MIILLWTNKYVIIITSLSLAGLLIMNYNLKTNLDKNMIKLNFIFNCAYELNQLKHSIDTHWYLLSNIVFIFAQSNFVDFI